MALAVLITALDSAGLHLGLKDQEHNGYSCRVSAVSISLIYPHLHPYEVRSLKTVYLPSQGARRTVAET